MNSRFYSAKLINQINNQFFEYLHSPKKHQDRYVFILTSLFNIMTKILMVFKIQINTVPKVPQKYFKSLQNLNLTIQKYFFHVNVEIFPFIINFLKRFSQMNYNKWSCNTAADIFSNIS